MPWRIVLWIETDVDSLWKESVERWHLLSNKGGSHYRIKLIYSIHYIMVVQLTPALTDFKGPAIFICCKRISVISNIEIKEIVLSELRMASVRQISITGGSARARFNCIRFLF